MHSITSNTTENAFDIRSIPGLAELWAETTGDNKICIAVIDTNIDYEHDCFKGADIKTIHLFNTNNNDDNESYSREHGTCVASIIFGQHHSIIKGLAPRCKGIIIPVFRSSGNENDRISCSQLDLARAIQTADQNGANIINISGGEFSASGKPEPILAETIQKCMKKGILIVSAAGNDGCECLHVPAADNSVLAIGAMDESKKPLEFSNWGKAYQSNGLLFQGHSIRTALPGNSTDLKSGTSFATAIASGIAGLLMSLLVKEGKEPRGQLVFDALIKSAFRCRPSGNNDCSRVLAGYVNVSGAINRLLGRTNFLKSDHLIHLPGAATLSDIQTAITVKNNLHEKIKRGVAASHLTTKKKTHLWNRSTKQRLQLI
jgi:cyanobactin maturation PatA/PatG family protease